MTNSKNLSPQKKTDDLVAALARDTSENTARFLKEKTTLSFSIFAGYWGLGSLLIIGLAVLLLPIREDLREQFHNLSFYILFLLWLSAALLPAAKVYALAFPDATMPTSLEKATRYAWAPLALVALLSVASLRFNDFGFQVYRESRPVNGGCGIVILVAGTLHAAFLYGWLRRGASTKLREAGAWVAISTGAFTSFVIQFACPNEHPLHILMWHFIPLTLLTAASAGVAKKLLRW